MIFVFDSLIPQHLSKVEEQVEDDYDSDEDTTDNSFNGAAVSDKNTAMQHSDNAKSGQPTEPYATVLGVKIAYSDAKVIAGMEVVEVFASYMPDNVLGMTDCTNKIWIRYGLGYLKKHVLIHEIEHVKDPTASEYIIRLRAKQRTPEHYVA